MVAGTKHDTCKSCGAAILWAQTPKGKWMPLDAEPNDKGNVVFNSIGLVVPAGENPNLRDQTHYLPHFATCPDAASYRKDKR